MSVLQNYLTEIQQIYSTGAATKETSFYPALASLFNSVGSEMKPRVKCVMNIKNRGAGIPDGGFFTASQLKKDEDNPLQNLPPERGVLEVKSAQEDVEKIAKSEQVAKYLRKYGLVLVTNLRDFLLVARDDQGNAVWLERFTLAAKESEFWQTLQTDLNGFSKKHETQFAEYLKRVFLHNAPLNTPEDVAFFLASYARDAKARLEANKDFPALESLKRALEESLGIVFTDEKGEKFFRSTLVQTLFYGIFSAWVLHSKKHRGTQKFDWHTATWELRVPMISALFEQIATPSKLKPLGLTEVLDWTSAVLNRVSQTEFFQKFEQEHAVQYFYEPFLQAFDPELRKELGVWYTPTEIVRYMVERVDRSLREELNITDGLANENVYVLDPCCGTGAYLTEVLRKIDRTLKAKGEDALSGNDVKQAAMKRVFGFEILPAPFVVAHLQLGLILQNLGSPLDDEKDERIGVYLTNALTGWKPAKEPKTHLLFPEMEEERDRAEEIKRDKPILVILGNPPYNAFAGTSPKEEQGLVEPYKKNLNKPESEGGWGIKKFNLDELYVRFFRLAERRIAEKTGKGIVCFISNFSYLSDPSFVVMRQRFLQEFDEMWFDNLNGDSRETGKLTPAGKPDPSVFSTEYNKAGIRVGTAISLLVRKEERDEKPTIHYREFWGIRKRAELLQSLASDLAAVPPDVRKASGFPVDSTLERGSASSTEAEPLEIKSNLSERQSLSAHLSGTAAESESHKIYQNPTAAKQNRLSFRPSDVSNEYQTWAKLTEIASRLPEQGLLECRGGALIDIDKDGLIERMEKYFDANVTWEDLEKLSTGLSKDMARFDSMKTRAKVTSAENFSEKRIERYAIRAFDNRWSYFSSIRPLWNEPRPQFVEQITGENMFLVSRPAGVASPEGVPFYFVRGFADYDLLRGHARYFPFRLRVTDKSKLEQPSLLGEATETFTANLSTKARNYLQNIGVENLDESSENASLIWFHALAIGYAPFYLTENADGIRNDFPRVPLPDSLELLQASANLGKRIADLLDTENRTTEIEGAPFSKIGVISRAGGGQIKIDEGELEITAGWGHAGKGGVTMPARGKIVRRDYAADELEALTETATRLNLSIDEITAILGEQTFDVYLNKTAFWRNVPANAWEYTIGGYQVIKKWLSYREKELLKRGLTADETREVSAMTRRLAALLLLSKELNANYQSCKNAVSQW